MPEVSIYPAYGAGAMIAARVDVPEVVPANRIKGLVGHDKTAYLFAWLGRHPYDRKCECYVCENTPNNPDKFNPFKRPAWAESDPVKPYVRFDIGARNVRFKVRGGEFFVVVAECDVDEWLAMLPITAGERLGNARLGLGLALPLTIERAARKSKKEVEAA